LLKKQWTVWIILLCWSAGVSAQTDVPGIPTDSISGKVINTVPVLTEIKNQLPGIKTLPEPEKVIWWAAAIPGYGQILNGKYWKLPIVYAGFMGCYFAVNYNSTRYVSFKNGYLDITDSDPTTNSHLDLIPEGRTIESFGGVAAFTGRLKTGMDQSRYYRDLSVIISIAYYGLTIIDAFVDAHLADFDISPDLSLQLRPLIQREHGTTYNVSSSYTYGLTGRVKF
jgi:hypothetical protein